MNTTRSLVILTLPVTACGCASTDPILAWQRKVADYVQTAGGGDPGVLRLIPTRHSRSDLTPARITVSKLDLPGPGLPGLRMKRDIVGVLVDTEVIDLHHWYVFLVGVLRRSAGHTYTSREAPVLESVCLAAFCWSNEGPEWIVGPNDQLARELYEDGAEAHGVRWPASSRWVFPRPEDCFEMFNTDTTLRVTEQRTGACWVLRWPE